MEEVLEELQSDRSGFDMPDGVPRCAVDLRTVHYPYDLADHVTPAWDEAGIEYQCYSSSRRGVLMMIGDPARRDEAARIALYYQLQLERHFLDFGVPESELTVGGRRIGIARRAGRTLTLSIDDDASICPGEMRDVVREGELYAGLLLGRCSTKRGSSTCRSIPTTPRNCPRSTSEFGSAGSRERPRKCAPSPRGSRPSRRGLRRRLIARRAMIN